MIKPELELSEEALAYIRWQEENPDVWSHKDHSQDSPDEGIVDLARLRENLKLTPAECLNTK